MPHIVNIQIWYLLTKALFNIKLIPLRLYSKEGLILMNEMQESSIRIIQNEEELLSTETFQALENICGRNVYAPPVKDSKKAFYGYGLGLCKKAINLAIINNSGEIFEDLLQRFIEQQKLVLSTRNENLDDIEQDTNQEINTFMISNPLQHKGKGHSSNKRYLSAIENNTMKYSKSNHHDEPAEGSKKRNKRQCSLCKSWYHNSRNCPLKNKPNLEDKTCNDKENV
ncbi:hypothetical protein RhiirA1_470395 [Rhizophagus irregularis]|uniref:Uncharacterized protein n=1 Tax=Rhizophagus irregularis TaxID=588596 RepID=A0A2N0R686_9GLOM|nr:hypothetical protein RhiirA1_470395 [Rhizophagus irregularis]CAB4478261.1 unnamed protein product [Rhizophagus irregularis]